MSNKTFMQKGVYVQIANSKHPHYGKIGKIVKMKNLNNIRVRITTAPFKPVEKFAARELVMVQPIDERKDE